MALTVPQQTIARSKTRFRVAICGRRFGKTIMAIRELCKFASIPRQTVWYVAPTYKQAKKIVWRQLKYKLQDLHWVSKVNESELIIELKNGSIISLLGADNPDSLRGVGLNFLVMDEFADIDPAAFYEVLRPTLADKQGSALFIGTPKGKGNWSYDLYQLGGHKKGWESFHYTTIEGGNVTQQEIEEARQLLDARTFNQEFNADFVTSGNRVWYGFDADESIKSWEGDIPNVLYTGWDFNIDPMSIVIFARHKDTIYAIDEIEIYSSNTDEAIEEIRSRYPKQRIIAYPDPAGRQRKTSAAGRTDIKILKNAGFDVKAHSRTESIRDGVNAVNSKLQNSLGERTFYVDPKCKRLIECLEKHNYKPGTTIPDKDTGYDHLTDAMRYYIEFEFPVKRALPGKKAPTRWGHKIG